MKTDKRILICPLNWGLGHATRCIPIIHKLQQEGNILLIASSGCAGELLQQEFPTLEYIHFPGFSITYSKHHSQTLRIVLSFPKIIYYSFKEHFVLKKLIKIHDINCVISDNRFGLWNKDITTAYITHQLNIKLPKHVKIFEKLTWYIHRYFIEKYNYCIIPDNQQSTLSLAGDLVHQRKLPKNAFFCSPLSRFSKSIQNTSTKFQSNILIILSGIEPQRSILEKLLLQQLTKINQKAILIQGLPNETKYKKNIGNITIISYVLHQELQELINNTDLVICRSGYSSIMDLVAINKQAIIIPTPGQPEQEYLAKYLHEKKFFIAQQQDNIDILKGMEESKSTKIPDMKFYLQLPF